MSFPRSFLRLRSINKIILAKSFLQVINKGVNEHIISSRFKKERNVQVIKMKITICRFIRSAVAVSAAAFLLFGLLCGAIPESFSRTSDGAVRCFLCSVSENRESVESLSPYLTTSESDIYTVNGDAMLFGVIPVKSVNVKVYDNFRVLPGGMPFGIKINSNRLTVAGVVEVPCGSGNKACPAKDAGLEEGDVIRKADGRDVTSADEFVSLIENSKGNVKLICDRNGVEKEFTVSPVTSSSDGKRKIGLWLRDGTAGIGTVTFIIPETGVFMGLGHSICDSGSGEKISMSSGTVTGAVITGVTKGKSGDPGELKGEFTDRLLGTVKENTDAGVLGQLKEIPEEQAPEGPVEIGLREEIKIGAAYIWCTTDNTGPKKYSIEIENLPSLSEGSNFEIKVTDPELISKTGGIVQGMSGSPIIQNGKLIGAVTHVMVNDPERGYGIFVEKMLDSASDPGSELQKSGSGNAA